MRSSFHCVLLLAPLFLVAGESAAGVGRGQQSLGRDVGGLRQAKASDLGIVSRPGQLALRGGFDPLQAVSTIATEDLGHAARKRDPIDESLLDGDVQRLFMNYRMDEEEKTVLLEQFDKVADDVHLTQQFLVLQNIRIEDQMPGGANCSYAESWYSGALWEKSNDEFQWTRAAWLQCERAKNWQEMPPVWKRIMRNAWDDFQDFLAMLALPDGGRCTERYKQHEEAWELVRAAYMSNLNRRTEELANGGMAAEVARRNAAVKACRDASCKEQQTTSFFSWTLSALGKAARHAVGAESEQDKLQQYESVEVQLFGIRVFNTKDAISERFWSMAAPQGEVISSWPLKGAAWLCKKLERTGLMQTPPEVPMTSDTHVLLGNTRYHSKYDKGVEKRAFNALDRLHEYAAGNFLERNSSVWNSIREDFENATAIDGASGTEAVRIMTLRTYKAFSEELKKDLEAIALLEHSHDSPPLSLDELAQMLSALSIRDERKGIEQLFSNHGGGELRMVAMALNISIPPKVRDWLDDPYADQRVMSRLLRHPRVALQLKKPDICDEPEGPFLLE